MTVTPLGLFVSWSQLDGQFTNGVLEGYRVRINSTDGELTSVVVNPADTAVTVNLANLNLEAVQAVTIEVAALNKAGLGPYSAPVRTELDQGLVYDSLFKYGTDMTIGLDGSVWVGALVGSLIIALVLISGVIVFYRRRFSKHQVYLEKATPTQTQELPGPTKDQSLWIDRRWNTEDSGEGSNSSDKRLLGPPENHYAENEYTYIDRAKLASFASSYGMSKQDYGMSQQVYGMSKPDYGRSKQDELGPDLAPYASTDILRSQLSGSIYNNRYFVSLYI